MKTSVRFLDNLIDINNYPLDKTEIETKKYRKIGLGVMGFADSLIEFGVRYGSEKSLELAEEVMSFINNKAIEDSKELGKERGKWCK